MLVEVLLKLLVGKVDVELFKSIHLKILKTKYVQNTDEGKCFLTYRNRTLSVIKSVKADSHWHT